MVASSASPRALSAWCLYDWANSPFASVIVTFVFATYFTEAVATDSVTGTSHWGYAMSLSALAIAIAGPTLGAVADRAGRRKPWLAAFTAIAVGATALLWFVRPDPGWSLFALVMVAIGNFAFETGGVFYNAMLPTIVAPSRIGRLSGWGWGLGYAGGVVCLAIALFALVQAETPLFGLDKAAAEHVRAVAPLVAAWFTLFALPLFLWTPDTTATGVGLAAAMREGVGTLWRTLREIRRYRDIGWFLLARMIYIDGLNTLFAFGGIYAAGTFGMPLAEVIVFGIALNVTAGLGAVAFAWVDDRIGPKPTILISLAALIGLGAGILLVETKMLFWAFGLLLGIFIGPTQAASRSMMAHMAPPELRTEMFGLFAFSGKVTAFIGPALLGWVTTLAGSQRAGMATILVFFLVGGALLLRVPPVRH